MTVSTGQQATQGTFNDAFVSKKADSEMEGVLSLNHTDTGAKITNAQDVMLDVLDTLGFDEGDTDQKTYANENYIANDDSYKTCIEKLDAQASTDAGNLSTHTTTTTTHGTSSAIVGVSDTQELSGKTFAQNLLSDSNGTRDIGSTSNKWKDLHLSGDAVIDGDLTVNGTTTSVETTNMEIKDANIELNKGGNQANANSAVSGITVEMSDATNAVLGYDSSLASKFKCGETGSLKEIVDVDSAQTLANKSVQTPSRLDVKQDTLANLTTYASTASNGQICFATDTKEMYQVIDSALEAVGSGEGSGIGGFNYIENYSFADDITGVATSDATNFAISHDSSTKFREAGSLKISKAASDESGEVVNIEFEIEEFDNSEILTAKFDYDLTDANYNTGDYEAYIEYTDDGGTTWEYLHGSRYEIQAGKGTASWQFQTDSTETEYRIAIECIATHTDAIDGWFKNVIVGPAAPEVRGAIITEWETDINFVLSSATWNSNSNMAVKTRRVGSNLEFVGTLAITGAPTGGGDLYLELPSSYPIDTAKINSTTVLKSHLGVATYVDASTGVYEGSLSYGGASNLLVFTYNGTGNIGIVNATNPITFGNTDTITFRGSIPIQGWSSDIVLSSSTSNRTVSLISYIDSAQAVTDGSTIVFTPEYDSHAGLSTGVYTIPEDGIYDVASIATTDSVSAAVGNLFMIELVKNGSTTIADGTRDYCQDTTSRSYSSILAEQGVKLLKDDTLEVKFAEGLPAVNLNASAPSNRFTVKKTGPGQTIGKEPKVYGSYSCATGQSIGTSATTIVYSTKVSDSNGIYNTSTGVLTIPRDGHMRVNANFLNANNRSTAYIIVYVDRGAGDTTFAARYSFAKVGSETQLTPSVPVLVTDLKKGDTIKIAGSLNTTDTLDTTGAFNKFDFEME